MNVPHHVHRRLDGDVKGVLGEDDCRHPGDQKASKSFSRNNAWNPRCFVYTDSSYFCPIFNKKDYYLACGTFSQLNRLGEKSTILNRSEVTYTSGTGCLAGAHVATAASRGACEVCVLRGPRMCNILSARPKARCTMKQCRSSHVLTQKSQTWWPETWPKKLLLGVFFIPEN